MCSVAKKTNGILVFTMKTITITSRKAILPLYSLLVKLYLKNCNQFWASQYKRDMDIVESVQYRARNINGRTGTPFLWEEVKTIETKQPGEEEFRLGLYQFVLIPERRMEREWSQILFSGVQCQAKRHKSKHRRFRLNIRMQLFSVQMIVMKSPSLEIFKSHLDTVLGNMVKVSLLEGNCTKWPPEVQPSNHNHSVIPY